MKIEINISGHEKVVLDEKDIKDAMKEGFSDAIRYADVWEDEKFLEKLKRLVFELLDDEQIIKNAIADVVMNSRYLREAIAKYLGEGIGKEVGKRLAEDVFRAVSHELARFVFKGEIKEVNEE